jgi:hypothetical protein
VAAAAHFDLCVRLLTHSNLAETISAALAAAALAHLAGGTLFDDEAGDAHSASEARTWARDVERAAAPYLEAG